MDVGSITARLGAHFDDSGFDRYDRAINKAKHEADNVRPAKLKGDFDRRGFDQYNRATRDVDHSSGRVVGALGKTGVAFRAVGTGAIAGAAGVGLLSKSVVGTATAINESLTKNQVLFGEHAKAVDNFAKTTAANFGISRKAALEATGTFGNLFTALDVAPKKSAAMSVGLTKLAADLASFNNASPEEALEAIRSGLVGETEPLRKFGVNLNDAALRTEALHQGLIKTTKEGLTPQQKALAVNALLFKQTEKAQGDFARTSGGLANQQRILKARLSDVGATIGEKMLPAATKAATALNDLLSPKDGSKLKGTIDGIGKSLGKLFTGGDVGAKLGAALGEGISKTNFKSIGDKIGGAISKALDLGDQLGRSIQNGISAALANLDAKKVGAQFAAVIVEAIGTLLDPGFWMKHLSALFAIVTVVIPIGKILKLPGFGALYRWISGPIFNAVTAMGKGLLSLFGKVGSRAFGAFLAEIEKVAPRLARFLLDLVTTSGRGLSRLPGVLVAVVARAITRVANKMGDGAGEVAGAIGRWTIQSAKAATRLGRAILGKIDDLLGNLPSTVGKWMGRMATKLTSFVPKFLGAGKSIGDAIGRGLSKAWVGILVAAAGFTNDIIDILNKIPGVDIGHVSWGQSSGRGAGGTSAPAAKPGTGRFAQGGKVTTPVAIMGEEAPQHPEWVIPTNPAYRKRAVALWMSAAREIGIPGFFGGGVLKSAGGALKKAGGAVLDVVGAPVRALLGLLPSIPGGLAGDVLGGAFKYAKDKAIDFIKSHVGLGGGGGGDSGVDGLVPRVLAALAYARTRGWGGSVTSGFRSYAQQAALYARYLAGGTLAAAPGTSNHEGGQAVDVSDTEGFAQAMAGAPGSVRLYRRVPGEPWHFSVTGFAKGGKFGKSKHLSSLASRGVVAGQGGLGKYEGAISDMERRYGLHDREFGLSQEEYVVEDEAGAHIDQRAVGHRLGELQDLVQLRQGIRAKILAYRKAVRAAIAAYQLGIRRLRRAIAAIPKGGKKAKRSRATATKLRQGYKDRISEYSGRLKDLGETESSLGFDAEDSRLDLVELQNEMSALSPDALKKLLPTPDTDGPAGDTGSGGDTGGPSDGAPTAADIAAAAAQQLASFNASRAELFAGFGANFNKAGTNLFGSDTQRAAGARFFGAVPADDAGILEGSGGSTVTVTNHYAAPPEDPHTWSRGLEWELRQG